MSCGLRRSMRLPFAIQHVDIHKMRPGIHFIVCAQVRRSGRPLCRRWPLCVSTQISLESTVPWVKGWPSLIVRNTTSSRYLLPGFERRERAAAAEPSVARRSPRLLCTPKISTRTEPFRKSSSAFTSPAAREERRCRCSPPGKDGCGCIGSTGWWD